MLLSLLAATHAPHNSGQSPISIGPGSREQSCRINRLHTSASSVTQCGKVGSKVADGTISTNASKICVRTLPASHEPGAIFNDRLSGEHYSANHDICICFRKRSTSYKIGSDERFNRAQRLRGCVRGQNTEPERCSALALHTRHRTTETPTKQPNPRPPTAAQGEVGVTAAGTQICGKRVDADSLTAE